MFWVSCTNLLYHITHPFLLSIKTKHQFFQWLYTTWKNVKVHRLHCYGVVMLCLWAAPWCEEISKLTVTWVVWSMVSILQHYALKHLSDGHVGFPESPKRGRWCWFGTSSSSAGLCACMNWELSSKKLILYGFIGFFVWERASDGCDFAIPLQYMLHSSIFFTLIGCLSSPLFYNHYYRIFTSPQFSILWTITGYQLDKYEPVIYH